MKRLLCEFVKEQWCLLVFAIPFLFAASLNDLLIPDYIGKICSAFIDGDDELAKSLIMEWVFIMSMGALFIFANKVTLGLTTEGMGDSLRNRLF